MPSTTHRDDDEHDAAGGACAECRRREPVGPCAACEAMICADCGVMSSDPSGRRVICMSCANLIAGVRSRPKRRPGGASLIALAVAIALALGALAIGRW